MITIALALLLRFAPVAPPPVSCEDMGPRLDGTIVTVCDGRVVAVRDREGNVRIRPFAWRGEVER